MAHMDDLTAHRPVDGDVVNAHNTSMLSSTDLPDLTLDGGEERVAIVGDWHGNMNWVQTVLPRIRRQTPVRTLLHLGDFGVWPGRDGIDMLSACDYWAKKAGIERILVTIGNHDDHAQLDARWMGTPGEMLQLSDRVFVLPRPFGFRLGGRTFLSLGGAVSIDREHRTEGTDWWPGEAITDQQVAAAIGIGHVEIMLAHETINGGTAASEAILQRNPGWGLDALADSSWSRAQATRVWEAVKPDLFFHGHMHVIDERTCDTGQRIYSVGKEHTAGNVLFLNLNDLSIDRLQKSTWETR